MIGNHNQKNIQDKTNKFFVGEGAAWLKDNLPDSCIDLTITSPPYDDLRTYEGFEFDYKSILQEIYRVTKPGGVAIWIVSDATKDGSETGTSFMQALFAKETGFNLHDTMIYKKANPIPLTHNRYEQAFEYMFVFTKGRLATFNPIKEETILFGKRTKRSSEKRKEDKHSIRFRNEETETRRHKHKTNVWEYVVGKATDNGKHPAPFPEELAQDHIISWSNEGDIVLDPMCGSGTTCKMAYLARRKFIGIDISEEYIETICKPRLQVHQKQIMFEDLMEQAYEKVQKRT